MLKRIIDYVFKVVKITIDKKKNIYKSKICILEFDEHYYINQEKEIDYFKYYC